jgi:hypothetical protein
MTKDEHGQPRLYLTEKLFEMSKDMLIVRGCISRVKNSLDRHDTIRVHIWIFNSGLMVRYKYSEPASGGFLQILLSLDFVMPTVIHSGPHMECPENVFESVNGDFFWQLSDKPILIHRTRESVLTEVSPNHIGLLQHYAHILPLLPKVSDFLETRPNRGSFWARQEYQSWLKARFDRFFFNQRQSLREVLAEWC